MKAPDNHGGWRVTIKRINPSTGRGDEHVFGVRTRFFSVARTRATQKAGFREVLKMEPLPAVQFAKEFPEGRNGSADRIPNLVRNHA